MKIKPNTLVEVTWLDSQTVPGWTEQRDLIKAAAPVITTVGYYSHCYRKKGKILWVVLKHSVDQANDGAGGYTIIPFGCVLRMERI